LVNAEQGEVNTSSPALSLKGAGGQAPIKDASMSLAKYIMIGGFLGAGKTTAILKLAQHLTGKGKRVGLINNDQSMDLVDTSRAKAAGHDVQEITGGCFCCKFDSLIDASKQLTAATRPDVLIAEPVGSCTDLKATVSYPLQEMYGDQYDVAPLSVLVDPRRASTILGLSPGKQFSEKVIYVYRKQLEEAEVIVINKIDLLAAAERQPLAAALEREFPRSQVIQASAMVGDGLEVWFDLLTDGRLNRTSTMTVDYDVYAEGEAMLGWVNIRGAILAGGEFDGNMVLHDFAARLKRRLLDQDTPLAHLKMTLAPREGAEIASLSLTRSDETPFATHRLSDPLSAGDLMVNLRAEADPDELKSLVMAELDALSSARFTLTNAAAFRPARPTPTHRVVVK
jgi:Ni2+-binding GTPase involved in maturation of urease and hydrogenase